MFSVTGFTKNNLESLLDTVFRGSRKKLLDRIFNVDASQFFSSPPSSFQGLHQDTIRWVGGQ